MLPVSREDMVLRSIDEVRWPRQKSPRWSAGGRACRSHGRRHPQKVPDQDVAPEPALPSLMFEGEGNEGGAPRLTTFGADESRLQESRRDALKSAGCLTFESENTRRKPHAPPSFRDAPRREPGIQAQGRCVHFDSG